MPRKSRVTIGTDPPALWSEEEPNWDDLTPRERLSLALDVINRSDLTPEAKLRLEESILETYDRGTPLPDSATTTSESLPNGPSPSEDSWPPTPGTEEWRSLVFETTVNFLMILKLETEMLYDAARTMPAQGPHVLMMEETATMLEMARIVATRINLDAREQSDLLVPEQGLVDHDGNPLGGHHDA